MFPASGECFALLRNPFILLCFLAIMCHVGIDVGTNTTALKILQERLGFSLDDAAFATSLYFIFRTIGCLTGSIILQNSAPKFMFISVGLLLLDDWIVGIQFARRHLYGNRPRGYGNKCLLMAFSEALIAPARQEKRGFGIDDYGTLRRHAIPARYGLCQRCSRQSGGCRAVMAIGVIYLVGYAIKLKNGDNSFNSKI